MSDQQDDEVELQASTSAAAETGPDDALSKNFSELRVLPESLVVSRALTVLSEVTVRSTSTTFGAPFYYANVEFMHFDGRIAPAVPIFGMYREPVQSIACAFRLPTQDFFTRVPLALQDILKDSRIGSIDIFVCVQEFLAKEFVQETLCLRPHFWLVPGDHKPTLKCAGNVQAMLFDFETKIDGELNSSRPIPLRWSIHPTKKGRQSLYSPSNGKICTPKGTENNAGWTLVMYQDRAALTLTAFLCNEPLNDSPFDAVVKFLGASTTDRLSLLDFFNFVKANPEHQRAFAPLRRHLDCLMRE